MARIKGRQARVGVSDARLLQVRVSQGNWAAADEAAARLGISLAAYVDAVLTHVQEELDHDGRPSWWTQQVPADQEELPLKSA